MVDRRLSIIQCIGDEVFPPVTQRPFQQLLVREREPLRLEVDEVVTDAGYANHAEVVWESLVDVTGFNDKSWLSGVGTIHTEQLHVMEHYKLNDDGTLSYDATVEDPGALTKPWVTGAVFRTPVDVRVEEYECIENNPDPDHMRKAAEKDKASK